MATPDLIALAAKFVSQWPQCIQPDAIKGIVASGCASDPQCFCNDKTFRLLLLGGMNANCTTPDMQTTQSLAEQLCPVLNEDRKAEAIVVVTLVTALALTAVILRVVSRRLGGIQFWWDDYLVFFAMFVTLGESANVYMCASAGLGRHIVTLSSLQIVTFLKGFWVTQVLFAFSSTALKFSILALLHRIFGVSRAMNMALMATATFQVAWFIAQIVSVMLSCRPLAYFWDKTIPNGHCINENTAGYIITAANLLSDLVIFVIPAFPLWGLQRSTNQRLGLIALFLAGALVCIAGAVRIPFLVELDTTDVTWSILPAGLWIQTEIKLGIMCACLPTLPPLFRRIHKAMGSHFTRFSSDRIPSDSEANDKANGVANGVVLHDPSGHLPAQNNSPTKKQVPKGWYSAALSNVNNDDELTKSSQEDIMMREKDSVSAHGESV